MVLGSYHAGDLLIGKAVNISKRQVHLRIQEVQLEDSVLVLVPVQEVLVDRKHRDPRELLQEEVGGCALLAAVDHAIFEEVLLNLLPHRRVDRVVCFLCRLDVPI